jgi:alpha-L-rhamnosidase
MFNDNVTWPSSSVIIPGTLHDQYADAGVIAQHYPSMVRWIDHMSGYLTRGIITKDNYGDWCVPPEDPRLIHSKDPLRKTQPGILATSYFYYDLQLMTRYATGLGQTADAQRFRALADQLKTAFNKKYLNLERGQYDNGSQTACVLPLAFDLVPVAARPRIFDHLVHKITDETRYHVGTGLVGGQWLNRVLAAGGRPDLAYTFATNTTYPSWGYMVENGATTVWELWNGNTADPAMNSGNHVMLVGDLVIWLYENLAGIQPDPEHPGFKHVLMHPTPVGDLQFVQATHRSPYGQITSHWQRENDRFRWQVTVPPNTTATLWVPAHGAANVTEGGQPAAQARGLKFLREEQGCALFEAGSGNYDLVGW